VLSVIQRGPYSILAANSSVEALAASFHAQPLVQMPQVSDFTFAGLVHQEMKPLLDRVRNNTRRTPKRLLADAGYASESNFKSLHRRRIDGYVSLGCGEKDPRKIPKDKHSLAMYRKVKTKRGKEQYRKRKWIVEPVYGWIKSVMGFRTFSLRGLDNVQGEWNLVCLAANLRRLNRKMEWT